MAFTSSTKSWAACNKDQQREAKALAVFTKLAGLPNGAKWFVLDARSKLLSKIDYLKTLDFDSLDNGERGLLLLESILKSLDGSPAGIESFERLYFSVGRFLSPFSIDPLGSADSLSLVKDGDLSKLVRAVVGFKWTGSSSKIPNGKSESSVGISDSFLDKLMSRTGAAGLLASWMQSSDTAWKKVVDREVKNRKTEIAKLKTRDPKNPMIRTLEYEIAKLEKDWRL